MESLRSYSDRASTFAKANPKMMIGMLAAFVTVVLALVVFFSVRKMDAAMIADPNQAKYVKNAKRSTTGLIVMAVLGLGAAFYQYKQAQK
jgi:hypothetical protein